MKNKKWLLAITVTLLLGLLCLPQECFAQRLFVRIDGIEGDSSDEHHRDWIDAWTCAEGILRPTKGANPTLSPIRIVKFLDRASVNLRAAAASGKSIKLVYIELTTNDTSKPVLTITLDDVTVPELTMTNDLLGVGVPDGPTRNIPRETVSFAFTMIHWEYTWYKPDGTVGGFAHYYWNTKTNTGSK